MNKPDRIDAWLEQLGAPAADRDYWPGHERMHALLKELPLNSPKLRIRIAGTNGKGSTACMLASALGAAHLSVGLYTSPHIRHFNERIRINNQPVPNASLLGKLQELMPLALDCTASYFEVATALALCCFSDHAVDVEILEAGVGARLDATTAIPADMALITPIALDHQAWLGNCLTDIAAEKAHAMDGCTYAISAIQSAPVARVLVQHRPDIHFIQSLPAFPKLRTPGKHQQTNAALALEAMECLKQNNLVSIKQETIKQAISRTEISGRLQYMRWRNCCIWLDAAHNPHAIEHLLPSLPEMANPFDIIFVFTREDRDLREYLSMLRPCTHRLVGADRYRNVCDSSYENLGMALDAELKSNAEKSILILGSFLTVSAGLQWIEENPA